MAVGLALAATQSILDGVLVVFPAAHGQVNNLPYRGRGCLSGVFLAVLRNNWPAPLSTLSLGTLFVEDGDVDAFDFADWQANYPMASGATHAMGDANGDGDVDAFDFADWQEQ